MAAVALSLLMAFNIFSVINVLTIFGHRSALNITASTPFFFAVVRADCSTSRSCSLESRTQTKATRRSFRIPASRNLVHDSFH